MSRLRRLFLSDRFFFITCCLTNTHPGLENPDFHLLADSIQKAKQKHHFLLTAWVFLPDHWHAIFFPSSPLTISVLVETIKVRSTHRINQLRHSTGSLWQPRFFDHAIRTVERYHHFVDYIHMNPVRRDLVRRPEEWAWSSMHSYMKQETPLLPVDMLNLPLDPQTRLF